MLVLVKSAYRGDADEKPYLKKNCFLSHNGWIADDGFRSGAC